MFRLLPGTRTRQGRQRRSFAEKAPFLHGIQKNSKGAGIGFPAPLLFVCIIRLCEGAVKQQNCLFLTLGKCGISMVFFVKGQLRAYYMDSGTRILNICSTLHSRFLVARQRAIRAWHRPLSASFTRQAL